MALKAVMDSVDSLSSDMQKEYRKDETLGKFVLDVTPVNGMKLADVENLTSALAKERDNASTASKLFKDLKGKVGDLDLIQAREALKKIKSFGDLDPEQKAEEALKIKEQQLLDKYNGQQEALIKKYSTEREALTSKLDTTRKQLQTTMIAQTATKAIADRKGSVELLQPIVSNNSRMVEKEDGTMTVEIIDPKTGVARISNKSHGTDPMTIDEFVEELKTSDVYSRAFDGSGASGSGAAGGNGQASTDTHTISAVDARDVGKYRVAREAAQKAGASLEIQET